MDFPQLTSNILVTHNLLQSNAMRAINQNITARNWLVGYWIVEFEQNGEDRAKYGDRLLSELAKSIDIKGLGATMLSQCRKFYLVYPQIGKEIDLFLRRPQNQQIFQTLTEKLQITENHNNTIFQSATEKLQITEKHDDRIFQSVIGKFQVVENESDRIFQSVIEESQSKICHGWNGRKLVCFQVLAPTARQREIC